MKQETEQAGIKGRTKMANVIDDETMEYVGILAKLELSEDEREAAKKDMGRMLDALPIS